VSGYQLIDAEYRNERGADCLHFRGRKRRRDVNLGVEGSNSNGHGRELDKEGNIMKIIEGLQRDAQARRDDNRKLMKVRN
jgi:hypothetical protein